jgi:thioredoxin type arsenate reductase
MITTILFLCTDNSCRSHMAEGWARHLKGDVIDAYSAGIEKHSMNPLAVKAMAEAGVNISTQESNVIDELLIKEFDWVVTLCGHANKTCPFFPGKRYTKALTTRRNLLQMMQPKRRNLPLPEGAGRNPGFYHDNAGIPAGIINERTG